MPLLGLNAEIKKILRIAKINLWSLLATRRECIFIPLKIAMRKRCKNAVGGVVHVAIQIAAESDLSTEQRRLYVQHTCNPVMSPAP